MSDRHPFQISTFPPSARRARPFRPGLVPILAVRLRGVASVSSDRSSSALPPAWASAAGGCRCELVDSLA